MPSRLLYGTKVRPTFDNTVGLIIVRDSSDESRVSLAPTTVRDRAHKRSVQRVANGEIKRGNANSRARLRTSA